MVITAMEGLDVLGIKTIQLTVYHVIQIGNIIITIAVVAFIGVIVSILTMFQVQTVYFVQMDVQVVPPQHIAQAVMLLSHTICQQLTSVVA